MFALLVSAVILGSVICTGQVKPKPTFEIRDLADSASAIRHVLKDQEGKEFFVGDTAFFSRSDMRSVTADKDPEGNGSVLNITWKSNCADRWTRYTASRVAKRIAIIANGKVLATPKVLDPILSPRIMVSLPDVDLQTAKKMAAELSPVKR
jgi:preprotein translocase subunit SecD